MAKFRNVTADTVSIPRYGIAVEAGKTFDVDDGEADGLAANPHFERIGGPASHEILADAAPAIPSPDVAPGGVTTSFHGN